jgi:thiol-disulfide isomerase/thioredoxin
VVSLLLFDMMRSILFLLFIVAQHQANAQAPSLLSLDQLNERIESGKDTIFIINFWATWCAPCVHELPAFEKFNKKYGTKEKVKVLLVSVDNISTLESMVQPFVTKQKLKSEVFLLNEKDQQAYIDRIDKSWSGTIPSTLFVKHGSRKFFEVEFSYFTLEKEYLNFKSRP